MRYNNNNQIIFEVGDWIIFKPAFSEEQIKQINNIVIYTVDDTKNYPAGHGQRFYCDDIEVFSTNSMLYSNVRLATQKEIDKAIEAQKPKFKISDWVTVIERSRTGYNKTFRIVGFDSTSSIPIIVDIRDTYAGKQYSKEQIRLVTAEEIKQAQRIDFKVGDWVYYLGASKNNDGNNTEHWKPGRVGQISIIDSKPDTHTTPSLVIDNGSASNAMNAFRLATPEEIELAKKTSEIRVGEYTAKYTNDKVYFGCKSYSKEFVNRMFDDMLQYDISLVIINGFSISRDLVKKIYNGF